MASFLKVTNLTRARVSIDSSVHSLHGLEDREIELTVAELEGVRDSLIRLEASGIITWEVFNDSSGGDADAQFVTLADLQAGISTSSDIDIYVSDSLGRDSNDGGSSLPLKTYEAAVALIPSFVKHIVTIHLAPHAGVGYELATIENKYIDFGAAIHVTGDDNFNELRPSVPALAGSSDILVQTAGLVDDAFLGKTIEILSGASVGDRRSIRNNTATSIVPVRAFTATIATGDLYHVVEPSVEIAVPDQVFPLPTVPDLTPAVRNCPGISDTVLSYLPLGVYGPSVIFSNLRLRASGPSTLSTFSIINSPVVFYGVESVPDAGLYLQMAVDSPGLLQAGMDKSGFTTPSLFPDYSGLAPSSSSWAGWGFYSRGLGVSGIRRFVGYFCAEHMTPIDAAEWTVYGGSFKEESSLGPGVTSALSLRGQSRVRLSYAVPPILVRSMQDGADRACIEIYSGSSLELSNATLEKTNQGSGIHVYATSSGQGGLPGSLGINEGVTITGITGVTSPDFGVSVSNGASMSYRSTLSMSGWPVNRQLAIRTSYPGVGSTVESQDLPYLTARGDALPSVGVSDGRHGWIRRL